jgi:hypothetical protein
MGKEFISYVSIMAANFFVLLFVARILLRPRRAWGESPTSIWKRFFVLPFEGPGFWKRKKGLEVVHSSFLNRKLVKSSHLNRLKPAFKAD